MTIGSPANLSNKILSPTFTATGMFFPDSVNRPVPTDTTFPICDFDTEPSARMIPDSVTFFAASTYTSSLSPRISNFIILTKHPL